jgi:hypothetical protein
MKGLILKDFINLKKNVKIFAGLTVLYGFMAFSQKDARFFSTIFTMLFAILTLSVYSYDELAKFDAYGMTMPVTRKEMVKSKYAMMLLLTLIGTAISAVFTITLNITLGNVDIFTGINNSIIGALIVILFYSITLPFVTKLGVEKARLIFFAIYFIPFAVSFFVSQALKKGSFNIPVKLQEIAEIFMKNIYIIAPLVTILVLGISYMISVKIYRKKEF